MKFPHVIRLRGPWECELLSAEGVTVEVPPRQIDLTTQEAALDAIECHVLRLSRSFQRPGRLDANESVWLAIENVLGDVAATLNRIPLGMAPRGERSLEVNISECLAATNRLVVELSIPAAIASPPDMTPSRVLLPRFALEIRRK